jgi:glycosyltransferase involved in cell wall biosynthesis
LITTPFLPFLILYWLFIPANKTIVDVRDLTWEYIISNHFLVLACQRLLRVLSIAGIVKARLVVACTTAECKYLLKYRTVDSVLEVNNGIEKTTIDYMYSLRPPFVRDDNGRPSILYAGTLGYAQGVEIICGIAKHRSEWSFEIIGDGMERLNIEAQINLLGLRNVHLRGKVSRLEVLDAYASASVLFFRLRSGFSTAIPSKVYEYLATGKPLVYMGDRGDAAWSLLQGFEATYFVSNDDLEGLALALRQALSVMDKFSVFNFNRIRSEFTREAQSGRLQNWIRKDNLQL